MLFYSEMTQTERPPYQQCPPRHGYRPRTSEDPRPGPTRLPVNRKDTSTGHGCRPSRDPGSHGRLRTTSLYRHRTFRSDQRGRVSTTDVGLGRWVSGNRVRGSCVSKETGEDGHVGVGSGRGPVSYTHVNLVLSLVSTSGDSTTEGRVVHPDREGVPSIYVPR